eukprot:gene4718-6623_t
MGKVQAQKSGGVGNQFDFLDDHPSSKSGGMVDVDDGFTTDQMLAVDHTEELVNQRDEEITRLVKSIEELASIFKDLSTLVIDQGTILDRIDFNMESAVENAKEGVKQLEKAEENQKNALSVKCIIALCVLIALMLAILIWKHSGKK